MKMSRSIKDYKDAMDSVKISDSFYKRTEVLLKESSEMEITKNSSSKIRLVSRAVMAAAACLLVAFGVKTVIDSRTTDSSVVTEMIAQETTVVTVPVTQPETASPVIDRPEDEDFLNDSGVQVGVMHDIPENGTDTDSDADYVNQKPEDAKNDDTEAEADTDDVAAVEETVTEEAAPKVTAETALTTVKEGYPEMAEPKGTENIPPLSEAAVDTVSVEITPYFDMGEIRSGENPVMKNGSEFSEVISAIASVTSVRPAEENEAFTAVFLVQLSEAETGLNYYTIYVTDASTLVVTRHDIDNQKRFTYELKEADYDKIIRLLYENFGAPNEYEYFRRTKVGK